MMKTPVKHGALRCTAGFLAAGLAIWYGILFAGKSSQNIGLADGEGDRAMLGGVEIAVCVADGTFENDATISAAGVQNRVRLLEDGKGAEAQVYTAMDLYPDFSGAHSAETVYGAEDETAQPLDAITSRTTSMYYLVTAQTFTPTATYKNGSKSRARIVLTDAAYTAPTAEGLAFAAPVSWNQGSYRAGDWSVSNGMGYRIAQNQTLVQDTQAAQLAERFRTVNGGTQCFTAADGTIYLWVNLPEGWGAGSRLYRVDSMEPDTGSLSMDTTVGDGVPQENAHDAIGTATLLTAFEPGDFILGMAEADGGLAVVLCRDQMVWVAALDANGKLENEKQVYSLPFPIDNSSVSVSFCARYAGEPDTDLSFVCEVANQGGADDTGEAGGTVQYATGVRISGGRVTAARTEAAITLPGTVLAGDFAGEHLTTFNPDAALLPGVQRLTDDSYAAQDAQNQIGPVLRCRLEGAYLTADGSALVTVEYIPTVSGRAIYDTQYYYAGQRTISVTGDGGLLYRGCITDTIQEDAQTWYRYDAPTVRSMICCADTQGQFYGVSF